MEAQSSRAAVTLRRSFVPLQLMALRVVPLASFGALIMTERWPSKLLVEPKVTSHFWLPGRLCSLSYSMCSAMEK